MILMLTLSLFGMGFLFLIGNDQLQETLPSLQFFADSNTYIKTYQGDAENFEGSYIKIDANYLGPMMILNIFQGNNYLILLFNVCIFTCSIIKIARTLKISTLLFAGLLLISPITLSSLLSVNKEIFLFPFLAFALNAFSSRSIHSLILAFILSTFVRWQLAIFYIAVVLISKYRNLLSSRIKLLFLMLITISIAYQAILPLIEPILLYVQLSIENYEDGGSGIFERLLQAQNSGLYFIVFPLKAFHLLFGMGFKIDKILNPVELYNDFFIAGHCAIAFAMFTTLALQKKLKLSSDFLFLAVIFLVFFCITPIFAPRYLYFTYILAALALAGAPLDLRALKVQRKRISPVNTKLSI